MRSWHAGMLPCDRPPRKTSGAILLFVDAISAHLDRGWDLIEKGDLVGAEKSARRILKLDKKAPEAYLLLGAAASARGDLEGAAAQYERAMEIDPDYVDPMLAAAEIYAFELDDPARAIALCEQALEAAAGDRAVEVDALLTRAEAELCAGQEAAARRSFGALGAGPLGEAATELRAGQLAIDLGDFATAAERLARTTGAPEVAADGWHALGLLAEERGDLRRMAECWLRTRELDRAASRPPWVVSEARFEEIAAEALAELPERIRQLLANVPILACDVPSKEIVAEGNDPRMMGFFSGVPWPEKSTLGGGAPHLDCIFLYQHNIERQSRTAAEMAEEIRTTLFHETGHFFGLDEDELDDLGLG